MSKMEVPLAEISGEVMAESDKLKVMTKEIEEVWLASVEFMSTCISQWQATQELRGKVNNGTVELQAISTDDHRADGKARVHKIISGSTGWPRALRVTNCGRRFGIPKSCRIISASQVMKEIDGVLCSHCHPEPKAMRRAKDGRRDEQGAAESTTCDGAKA